VRLDELVNLLDGYNVAVVSDDAYGSILFVNYLLSAMCERDVLFVIYSEISANKLYKIINSLPPNQCIKHILNNAAIVKIGKNNEIKFGKLAAFIEDRGELGETALEIGRIIKEFGRTTFFFGFSLGMITCRTNDIVKAMDLLLSKANETMYFIISESSHLDFVANLFDVIIKISKTDILSFGNIYDIYVEHSIVPELELMPLYRMDESNLFEI